MAFDGDGGGARGTNSWLTLAALPNSCRNLVVTMPSTDRCMSLGIYGRPRMTEKQKEVGVDVGHRRVGWLMRENGMVV